MAVLYVMFAVSVYKMNSNGKEIGIRRVFTILMELPVGIEPTLIDYKSIVLPLNYRSMEEKRVVETPT